MITASAQTTSERMMQFFQTSRLFLEKIRRQPLTALVIAFPTFITLHNANLARVDSLVLGHIVRLWDKVRFRDILLFNMYYRLRWVYVKIAVVLCIFQFRYLETRVTHE